MKQDILLLNCTTEKFEFISQQAEPLGRRYFRSDGVE